MILPRSMVVSAGLRFGFLVSALALPTWSSAQIEFPAASPAGVVKQRVGLTDVAIEFNRPSAHGRVVFGGLVPYDAVWRTGANTSTKLTLSTAAKINGAEVAAGTYELFTIPGRDEWTVIVHQNKSQWGSYAYDAANDVVRVTAKPIHLDRAVETLSFEINDVQSKSATLNLSWEHTLVPVTIEVDPAGVLVPQIEAVMASDAEKKPYFAAAMFYYDSDLDLTDAVTWMAKAVEAQPKAYWMIYRQGLVLAKSGDKAGAMAAAKRSLELVAAQPAGEIREEYTRLNEALIERLK
jgi:hypothetical protein